MVTMTEALMSDTDRWPLFPAMNISLNVLRLAHLSFVSVRVDYFIKPANAVVFGLG